MGGAESGLDTSVHAPTAVAAKATSDSQVGVSWGSQANAKSYIVYYSTTSPVTKASAKSSPVSSSYSGLNFTSGVAAGTTYYFAVSASNSYFGDNESDLSVEVSATTLPSTPDIVVTPSDGQVQITWNSVAGVTYKVYHAATSTFTKTNGAATVVQSATSPITVSGLTNGQVHYFAATAAVNGSEGDLSPKKAVVSGPTLATGANPIAPQLFVVSCFFANQPTFSWAKQAGVSGYRIYHSTTNPVTTADAYYSITSEKNDYSLFASGTTLSGTNYFAMTALNGTAESVMSAQISCP